MCIGSAIPAVSPTLGWGIGGRIVTGLGTGMGWLATLKMLAISAPGGRAGAYQAFFAGLFSLGSILAYLLIPVIAGAGWQWVFLTPAILCLLQLFLVPVLKGAPARLDPSRSSPAAYRENAGRMAIGHLPCGVVRIDAQPRQLGPFAPRRGLPRRSATQLAWGGALVMLVSGLGRISGGFIIFRISPYTVAHGSILALCLLFAGLALIPEPAMVLAMALLGAWFGSVVFAALFQLAQPVRAGRLAGRPAGFRQFPGEPGGGGFHSLFGWSKDALGSFTWGFALLAPLAAAALAAGWRVLGKGGKPV